MSSETRQSMGSAVPEDLRPIYEILSNGGRFNDGRKITMDLIERVAKAEARVRELEANFNALDIKYVRAVEGLARLAALDWTPITGTVPEDLLEHACAAWVAAYPNAPVSWEQYSEGAKRDLRFGVAAVLALADAWRRIQADLAAKGKSESLDSPSPESSL